GHVGAHKDGVGAPAVSLADRHGRTDAVSPGLIGAGGDDSPVGFGIGSDDEGLAAVFGMEKRLDAGEKGVHVDVDHGPPPSSSRNMRRHCILLPDGAHVDVLTVDYHGLLLLERRLFLSEVATDVSPV